MSRLFCFGFGYSARRLAIRVKAEGWKIFATVRSEETLGSKVIMINDVARAFFEAPAVRNVCVEIPKEDRAESDARHDKVGHLRMSLYGTRDAAMNLQEEVARQTKRLGFQRGSTTHACTTTPRGT